MSKAPSNFELAATDFLLVTHPAGGSWTVRAGEKPHQRAMLASHLAIAPLFICANANELEPWLRVTMADLEGARLQRDIQRRRADELQTKVDQLEEVNLHHRNLQIEAGDVITALRAELQTEKPAARLGLFALYRSVDEAELHGERQPTPVSLDELLLHAQRYLLITRHLGLRFKQPNAKVTTTPEETDTAIDAYSAQLKEQKNVQPS